LFSPVLRTRSYALLFDFGAVVKSLGRKTLGDWIRCFPVHAMASFDLMVPTASDMKKASMAIAAAT
jgi:hypothetical protein